MSDQRAGDALIEQAANAALDAWNADWKLNPEAMSQAGESFKRRFYAEVIISYLRSLPVEQRMEAMGMERVHDRRGNEFWQEKP